MALAAGQVFDHIGAKITHPELPDAKVMFADKGYDGDENRAALRTKGIEIVPRQRPWDRIG